MIKKIYLDMDGVLSDFVGRFTEMYGPEALGFRDKKNYSVYWPDFIQKRQFETLDWHPGGKEILQEIRKLNIQNDIPVEILSSSGGQKHHDAVKLQKKIWLLSKNITFPANIVPGRKHKAEYAGNGVILIDDTEDVTKAFTAAGGIGIHHTNVRQTLSTLHTLASLPD